MTQPTNTDGRLQKPPVNEVARIVNSHFLQSPYEGKDWDSVRADIIEEVTAYIEQEKVVARVDERERNTGNGNYLGQDGVLLTNDERLAQLAALTGGSDE